MGSRILRRAFDVGGESWESLLEQYDVSKGHLWPFVLASVAAAPLVWARRGRPA